MNRGAYRHGAIDHLFYKSIMTETLFKKITDKLASNFQVAPVTITPQFKAAVIREIEKLIASDTASQQLWAAEPDDDDSDSHDGEIRAGVLCASKGSGLTYRDLIHNVNLSNEILGEHVARRAMKYMSRINDTEATRARGMLRRMVTFARALAPDQDVIAALHANPDFGPFSDPNMRILRAVQ